MLDLNNILPEKIEYIKSFRLRKLNFEVLTIN